MTNHTTHPSQTQDDNTDIPEFIRVLQSLYDDYVVGKYPVDPMLEVALLSWFYGIVLDGAQTKLKALNERKIQYLRKMNYPDYLQTDHWQTLRKSMLEYANYRCQLCNDGAVSLHVHHRTYENRGRETSADLIVLCANCHQIFHDKLEVAK